MHKVSNNTTSIIAKDAQTSTMEIIPSRKSCQKINSLKKNDTNIDSSNTNNEQENGTNSGHSSSNESNNIDKRKKGTYLLLLIVNLCSIKILFFNSVISLFTNI